MAGRVTQVRNGLGRLTAQTDINGYNGLVQHTRSAGYNSKGQLISDDVSVWRNDDIYRTLSSYSYGTGADYALGAVTQVDGLNWKDGAVWPTTRTVNIRTGTPSF